MNFGAHFVPHFELSVLCVLCSVISCRLTYSLECFVGTLQYIYLLEHTPHITVHVGTQVTFIFNML
jgi:hypothetical protein